MLASDEFDLVVLDIGLPDIDGFEVLRRLRARRVADQRARADRARRGRGSGARPRSRRRRLPDQAVLGRPSSRRGCARCCGALRSRPRRWSVGGPDRGCRRPSACASTTSRSISRRANGRCSSSSSHVPAACSARTRSPRACFTFDEQLSPNAIEVHVSRLRTKIEPAGVHIRTVRGFGYLWEGGDE